MMYGKVERIHGIRYLKHKIRNDLGQVECYCSYKTSIIAIILIHKNPVSATTRKLNQLEISPEVRVGLLW